jgi:hypothetical protein
MEFGKAFTYPFQDPDWIKKLGIAGLLLIIPIIGWLFLAGWMLETIRRVIQRDPTPLADWSDFGGYLVKGLQAFVVGLVYALPVILISICQQVVTLGIQQGGSSDQNSMTSVITILALCISCVSLIYNILLGLVLPAAYANLVATGQMGAAFRFGEVFGLVRAAPAAYIIALLGGIVSGFIAGLGLIICFIGVFFTAAYATAINAHLYGQAYNVATAAKGGGAIA